jgi:hypothetical protein
MIGTANRTMIHGFRDTVRHSLTEPGVAFFAATGPKGEVCAHCQHFEPGRKKFRGTCKIYKSLMPTSAAPSFDADTSACKYFDNKKEAKNDEACTASTVVILPLTPRQRTSSVWQRN